MRILRYVILLGALAAATYFGVRSQSKIRRDRAALSANGAKTSEVVMARRDAEARVESGALPVSSAIHVLATRGRMGASADITPTQSGDPSPLTGWVFRSRDVPDWMVVPPPAPTPSPSGSASAP